MRNNCSISYANNLSDILRNNKTSFEMWRMKKKHNRNKYNRPFNKIVENLIEMSRYNTVFTYDKHLRRLLYSHFLSSRSQSYASKNVLLLTHCKS